MAEASGGNGRTVPRSHALQVTDAYSRLRDWLRDCAASAPIEELRAVLARVEHHRAAEEWPEVADARSRYKALRKAKAQLGAALERAPVDALQEAISHATAEPELYHSRAQLALSNSIAGLEAALARARSSGLDESEDVRAAEVRLRVLRRLYEDMEALQLGVAGCVCLSSPSRRSTEVTSLNSTMEPGLKLHPDLSTPTCRSTELTSPNGTAEPGSLRPMLRVAPLLSISTCSADEPPGGSPEAALAGVETSLGSALKPFRASVHVGRQEAAVAGVEASSGGKIAPSKPSDLQHGMREVNDSSGDLLAATPPAGSTRDGAGKMLPGAQPLSPTVAGKSLSDHLAQHALPPPPSSPPSLASALPSRARMSSRCRVPRRRCRRGRSGSSRDDDSSRSKLQAEVCALSEAHFRLEREAAEERHASEVVGEQAAAVELLSCLDRAETGQFRWPNTYSAAAQQLVPKSGHLGSIAWLLLQTNGERRLQLRHLELSEQRLCRENEHLRQHSAAREREMGSESVEAFCQERQMLEQRSTLLLEELRDIRLHEQELAHENSELRSESRGMQQRVIVAGELARHAQVKAEHAVLEVQQAAAEIVGASPYPSESSMGSRALPPLTSSDFDVANGNAQNTGSDSVMFDAREAVELCSWDTMPGEVCVQPEDMDASGSFEAGTGESIEASGSYEAHGAAATGNTKEAQPEEPLNQESMPIEDFMNEFRRFQSWS